MVDSNSNTLRYVIKEDISLGNSGASNCWARQMKDAFGDLQNGTVYIIGYNWLQLGVTFSQVVWLIGC
jgi:hypothetical protein